MRAKKCVSLLLSVCMVAGMLATTGVGASAAEGKVISNVSFSGVVNPKAGDTINVAASHSAASDNSNFQHSSPPS